MIGQLLRRIAAKPAPAAEPAPLPETLDLAAAAGVRVIYPAVAGGYAVLANSSQGLFIVNRNDNAVGYQLTDFNAYDPGQMEILRRLVEVLPPAPVMLDVGANIGVVSLVLARAGGPAGVVHAFEAQRVVFNMLAGNMAINSIDNVHCYLQAVGASAGTARVPRLDYRQYGSFGSVELNREHQSDARQQALDGQFDEVRMDSIDALGLSRADLIKIDVEGMEAEVLAGAADTLRRHRPLMLVEHLKSGKEELWTLLSEAGYLCFDVGFDFVCIPEHDARTAHLVGTRPAWRPDAPPQP